MKLHPLLGESLHRLCCADPPTDIVSHCGPVAGEFEPRAAVAKVRSEHDRGMFLGHRYGYKILADSVRLACVSNAAVEGANKKPG
jgi:hypothetical protein